MSPKQNSPESQQLGLQSCVSIILHVQDRLAGAVHAETQAEGGSVPQLPSGPKKRTCSTVQILKACKQIWHGST